MNAKEIAKEFDNKGKKKLCEIIMQYMKDKSHVYRIVHYDLDDIMFYVCDDILFVKMPDETWLPAIVRLSFDEIAYIVEYDLQNLRLSKCYNDKPQNISI